MDSSFANKKHYLVTFVHSLFQWCISFSFNYIGYVRMSIIIPTSILRFTTLKKYKFKGKIYTI